MTSFSFKARGNLDVLLEVPLDPLETPSPPLREERVRRAKEARKLQLLQYQRWEKEKEEEEEAALQKKEGICHGRVGGDAAAALGNRAPKKVSFSVKDRLRDAVMRSDQREGERTVIACTLFKASWSTDRIHYMLQGGQTCML